MLMSTILRMSVASGFAALLCLQVSADTKTIVLNNPVLGTLVIGVDPADEKGDVKKLARFFSSVRESTSETPKCDVLFLYAQIGADGSLRGSPRGLQPIIHESGAAIIVIAAENPPDNYIDTTQSKPYKGVFLVMTSERKGDVFAAFFEELFSRMQRGSNIASAWVELVPQGPVKSFIDAPGAIAVSDTGPITFTIPSLLRKTAP